MPCFALIVQKEEDVKELCSEVTSLLRVQKAISGHENIVRLHELLEDEASVHLVMDYCAGGDLFDYIAHQKRLSEKETAQIFKQLVTAVNALHLCGLVHRDLKPENILLTKPKGQVKGRPQIKVADFGLAVVLARGQQARGVAGSPFYMAPEVIKGKFYGREVDVWSMGVILYTCLAGSLPFWGKGHEAVFTSVCRAKPDFVRKPWPIVSPEAKHLIRQMLHPDPTKRVRLVDVLSHPWLVHHCPELKSNQNQPPWIPQVPSGSPSLLSHSPGNFSSSSAHLGSSPVDIPAFSKKSNEHSSPWLTGAVEAMPVGGPPVTPAALEFTSCKRNGEAAENDAAECRQNALPVQSGSPSWLLNVAARRVLQAGANVDTLFERKVDCESQAKEDLHRIPSPPRAAQNQSRSSSPSLLHKFHVALSLAHPFPRLYMPFSASNSPMISGVTSPQDQSHVPPGSADGHVCSALAQDAPREISLLTLAPPAIQECSATSRNHPHVLNPVAGFMQQPLSASIQPLSCLATTSTPNGNSSCGWKNSPSKAALAHPSPLSALDAAASSLFTPN